jgi:hypothetical protein
MKARGDGTELIMSLDNGIRIDGEVLLVVILH